LWHTEKVGSLNLISVLLIAIGLSADCFAIAISGSISMPNLSSRQVLRASFAFGLFQALMPVLGWLAGKTVVDLIASYDHWVAFALLTVIGGRMILASFRTEHGHSETMDITRGMPLLALSVATSIDALAVGLTLAFIDVNILLASLTIGIVAFVVTLIGFFSGKKLSSMVGKRAETLGGIVLLGIGLRILLTHVI
jgi:manganese efflux pump family protein